MITIMVWNNVELVDGKFYFVDVVRWRNNEPNEWVFAYKENQVDVTQHYCAACISQDCDSLYSIYDNVFVCSESKILNLRPATQEDMRRFWDYLDRWNCRYCLNTKKLRHVGRG